MQELEAVVAAVGRFIIDFLRTPLPVRKASCFRLMSAVRPQLCILGYSIYHEGEMDE
jgi:hypothetical protein